MDEILKALRSYQLRFGNEKQLQDDVEVALRESGIPFSREHCLGKDKVDFFVSGVAVECKVDGGKTAVLEQLLRYADKPEVTAVILVTSRHTQRYGMKELRSKPFRCYWVAGVL